MLLREVSVSGFIGTVGLSPVTHIASVYTLQCKCVLGNVTDRTLASNYRIPVYVYRSVPVFQNGKMFCPGHLDDFSYAIYILCVRSMGILIIRARKSKF